MKKMLPGLLPIFVFIIADEIWGTKIGLLVAVGFGLVQLGFVAIKEKRLDRFVLFDTLLLVVMGAVSILLDNDIFFKIKPAIIGVILSVILGFSAYGQKNLMLLMSKRYLKDVSINQQQEKLMNNGIRVMFWLLVFHTFLTIYAAFFMSNTAWAFISGTLFYILLAVVFLLMFVINRVKMKKQEWLPLVDKTGKCIGTASRQDCHSGSRKMHPVVHLHVFNHEGEVLLQKRPLSKKVQPGMWDTAVGGHISAGETLEVALSRECREEIGVLPKRLAGLSEPYVWETDIEQELVYSYLMEHEGPFMPEKKEEIDELRFFSVLKVKEMIDEKLLTPNFCHEWPQLQLGMETLLHVSRM